MSPKQILATAGVGCLLASTLVVLFGLHLYRRAKEPITAPDFPDAQPVEGLVSAPVPLLGRGTPFFVQWFDGTDVLLLAKGEQLRAVDASLETLHELELPGPPLRIVSVEREGQTSWFVLHGSQRNGRGEQLSRLDSPSDIEPLWVRQDEELSFEDLDLLRPETGPALLLLSRGGEDGIVAFDQAGRELWREHAMHVHYGVSVDPTLPGYFLHSGWDSLLYRHRDGRGPESIPLRDPRHYVSGGELARRKDGTPLVFAFGQDFFDHETLSASSPDRIWKAKVPFDLNFLTVLTPKEGTACLAALGREGELLLCSLEGQLLFDGTLPDANAPTYGLNAGPLPDGSWGLVAVSLGRSFFYRIQL